MSATSRGGPLFVPPPRGDNRIANPDLYHELYLSTTPSAAVGETFGRYAVWNQAIFGHPRGRYAVASFTFADARLCDLDDAPTLVRLNLRPTNIVTRDRATTQAWSRTLFLERAWSGVSWWSYYLPEWTSVALWETSGLLLDSVRDLSVTDSDVIAAASALTRLIRR